MAVATKTQVMTLLAPRAGLNMSLPADLISELDMSQCQNVRIEEGMIKKYYGYTTLGNNLPLPNTVIGLYQLNLYSGSDYFLACTTDAVYRLADPTGTPYWETIMDNEVEDDCETTWTDPGDNIDIADDAVDFKVGSKSQKITVAAGFTTPGLAGYRDQALGDKSTYSFVRFWIKSDIATAAGDLQFVIHNVANMIGALEDVLDIPALTAGQWTLVFLPVSSPVIHMDEIASMGIYIVTDNGAQVIHIDDIRFVKSFTTGATYDANNSDLMTADTVRDTAQSDVWWVMTNQVDAIQKWTGSTTTGLAALGGSPGVCEHLVGFKDYLLLLDVSSYRQRVKWPDTADFEDWSAGNSGSQDLTGADFVMYGVRFKGDYVVLAKKKSIWLGYSTADSDIFQFDQRVSGIGTVAPKTLVAIGDIVVFLGEDDVYSFDGIDCVSIGEQIRDELVDMQNPKQHLKAFGYLVMEKNEYHLALATSSSTYCDREYVWNYKFQSWTKRTLTHSITCHGEWQKQTTVTIGDLTGTIGEQTWRIGERWNLAATPTTVFGDLNGYVYEMNPTLRNDNGTAVDGWFSTKDFNPTGLTKRWRLLRIDVYFTGGGLDVEYSTDKGASWIQIASFTENNDLETPQMTYCKLDLTMARLRFRNAIAGETFEFSRANIYWQEAGIKL